MSDVDSTLNIVEDHNWGAPGQPAEVDYQGQFPTCVIHSVAKAFCDGCDRGKWSGGITFDAWQDEVVSSILALFPNLGKIWPDELHGKIFEVFDQKSQFEGKFEMKVTTMQKNFQKIDQTEYYVLTYKHPKYGNHCVYVETYNPFTGTFGCMNSWGPITEPRPLINKADVIQVDMIEFELKASYFKQQLCEEKRHINPSPNSSFRLIEFELKESSLKRQLDDEKRHGSCLSNASSNSSFDMIEIELMESSFHQQLDDESTFSSLPFFHNAIGLFASSLAFPKTEAVARGRRVRKVSCMF